MAQIPLGTKTSITFHIVNGRLFLEFTKVGTSSRKFKFTTSDMFSL